MKVIKQFVLIDQILEKRRNPCSSSIVSSGRSLQKTENPIMAIEVFQPKVIRSHHNKGRLVSLDPHRHILFQILSQFSIFHASKMEDGVAMFDFFKLRWIFSLKAISVLNWRDVARSKKRTSFLTFKFCFWQPRWFLVETWFSLKSFKPARFETFKLIGN